MNEATEIWKPVSSTHNIYHASSEGRIKTIRKNHLGQTIERIIKVHPNKQGYLRFHALFKNYNAPAFVHRFVAEAFHGNVDGKNRVNHIDCNPLNNKPENLEWCTQRENILYAYRLNRLSNVGLTNGQAVIYLHLNTGIYFSRSELGRLYGMTSGGIRYRHNRGFLNQFQRV